MQFFYVLLTSSLLGPNILLLSTLFSNTLNLTSFPTVRDQTAAQTKQQTKFNFTNVNIQVFLRRR